MKFRKLDYNTLQIEIVNSSPGSAVYLGCDSKLSGCYTIFGLVAVIHIEKHRGGMVFGQKFVIDRRMPITERLMKEVDIVVNCAFMINDYIGKRIMEVHLDINQDPEYESNKVMKQAVSYVKSQGFIYKIKPWAWAATTAADYLIK